jgi:hypothetical protein
MLRHFSFGLLLVTTLFTHACASGTSADRQPIVTAHGSAGDEDVPDITLPKVTLKPGETLLVSCNDEGGDATVSWNGSSLHGDVSSQGSGFNTTIFSLYSAAGGTGDIIASHASAGDLAVNAYSVTNLAPSALDKTSAAKGRDTTPSSGATATTSHPNEFLWGTIGYATNEKVTGTWNDGFTPGTQFTISGGISGVEDGYKTVSATGAYTAAKTGIDKDAWTAVIATYALAK